jgi:hypothetical protein
LVYELLRTEEITIGYGLELIVKLQFDLQFRDISFSNSVAMFGSASGTDLRNKGSVTKLIENLIVRSLQVAVLSRQEPKPGLRKSPLCHSAPLCF